MLKKSMRKVIMAICAACVLTAVLAINVNAADYTASELYSGNAVSNALFTDAEKADYSNKYGKNARSLSSEAKWGKIPASLKKCKTSIENDRTGGINIRWTNCNYSVLIERYNCATKKWEALGYKSADETTCSSGSSGTNNMYMIDTYGTEAIPTTKDADNYYLYEDNNTQVNKSYKYRITPFNIFSQSRAEAAALGKESAYDNTVNEYKANGCQVIEENGYTVVFYQAKETKKVKNTLEAPFISVKETEYCSKCKEYGTSFENYGAKCGWHKSVKCTNQLTFDIEWQDVDGYEIYYSKYSDSSFKKWKTIKPKKISHSLTTYPNRDNDIVISTVFQYRTKLSYGKYFYKIRSYVIVDGKKVYSKFSPVASKYDYLIHDFFGIKEDDLGVDDYDVADVQATEEFNKLNRLMNENGYLWQKYLAGKVGKSKFYKEIFEILYPDMKYGIYKKTVKSITKKQDCRDIVNDVIEKIKKANPKMENLDFLSVNVSYKKSKKVYEIRVAYRMF